MATNPEAIGFKIRVDFNTLHQPGTLQTEPHGPRKENPRRAWPQRHRSLEQQAREGERNSVAAKKGDVGTVQVGGPTHSLSNNTHARDTSTKPDDHLTRKAQHSSEQECKTHNVEVGTLCGSSHLLELFQNFPVVLLQGATANDSVGRGCGSQRHIL
jgi:hypothetical protein